MGVAYNSSVVTEGLRVYYDALNPTSYPGIGNTMYSLNETEDITATNLSVASDTTAGLVLDHNNTTGADIFLSSQVNHEVWSMILWVRSTGLTPSNYRNIVRLVQPSGPGYFYIMDTRLPTNHYVLGYQQDYYDASYLTYSFNTEEEWEQQKWWCFGVSHDNTVFRHYVQGDLKNTQTQTRNVADYTDIDTIMINYSDGNTVYMGPFLFYDRILTDGEFKQNFIAMRGRFGV
jgi:hypothetical protein